ncbi:MAG: virulence RhuM family protein [Bacteroidales bacterium]|nr:virulence RhuM family protein [Bacteroidales bacterium]
MRHVRGRAIGLIHRIPNRDRLQIAPGGLLCAACSHETLVANSVWPAALVIKEILITADDGKNYRVNHYDLRVIIALGFKIDNEKAIAFRKWTNQIVTEYTIKGWVMDDQRLKDGTPIAENFR